MATAFRNAFLYFAAFSSIILEYSFGFHPVWRRTPFPSRSLFIFSNAIQVRYFHDSVDADKVDVGPIHIVNMVRKNGSSAGVGFGSQVASRGKKVKRTKFVPTSDGPAVSDEITVNNNDSLLDAHKIGKRITSQSPLRLDVDREIFDNLELPRLDEEMPHPATESRADTADSVPDGIPNSVWSDEGSGPTDEGSGPAEPSLGSMPLAGFKVAPTPVSTAETAQPMRSTPGGWVDVLGWMLLGGPLWVYELRPLYVDVSPAEEVVTLGVLLLLPKMLSLAIRSQAGGAGNSTESESREEDPVTESRGGPKGEEKPAAEASSQDPESPSDVP